MATIGRRRSRRQRASLNLRGQRSRPLRRALQAALPVRLTLRGSFRMVTSLEFDGQLRGDEISKADDAAWPGLPLRSHCRQERLLAGSSLPATSMDCRIRVARRQCAPEISRARRSTAPGRDEPKRSSSWPPETGHPRRASRGNSERITRGRLWPGLPIRGVRRQLPLSKPTIKPKDCCLAWPGTVSPGHNQSLASDSFLASQRVIWTVRSYPAK